MNREREKLTTAAVAGTCAMCLGGILLVWCAIMGRLWLQQVSMLVGFVLLVAAVWITAWNSGRMWERENGARKCGARSVDEEEEE